MPLIETEVKFGDRVRVLARSERVVGELVEWRAAGWQFHTAQNTLAGYRRGGMVIEGKGDEGWPGKPIPEGLATPAAATTGTYVRVRRFEIPPTDGIMVGKVSRSEGTRHGYHDVGGGYLGDVHRVDLVAVALKPTGRRVAPEVVAVHPVDLEVYR